uniref:Uncharacterized protein n=1 Tax=Opuntia streptacantha TaxID=393608 RepID=A0A7C9AAK3_OPUST
MAHLLQVHQSKTCTTSMAVGSAQLIYCPSTQPWTYYWERQDSWTPPSDQSDKSISLKTSLVLLDLGHAIQSDQVFLYPTSQNVLPHLANQLLHSVGKSYLFQAAD